MKAEKISNVSIGFVFGKSDCKFTIGNLCTNGTIVYMWLYWWFHRVSICQKFMPEISVRGCSVKVSSVWKAMANLTVVMWRLKSIF